MTTTLSTESAFRTFLDDHLDGELVRIATAGSVDDGKSTLIGRLLHDTRSVYEDQLAAVRASRVNRTGTGAIDLSLLTDGLKAEREQGITIDVAYRYFSTARRKFILADTPGHEQYTRNMATGASTADIAIVLIDALAYVKAGGLLPQSRRHTSIANLLRIPHVVAAVNKMDLVAFDQQIFNAITADFRELAASLSLSEPAVVPVSALSGDNVVEPSRNMPWYTGPTLLQFLETVPVAAREVSTALRFPVQLVIRPDGNFRGFAGRIESGELRPGMTVQALPSGRTTRVRSIVTFDGELKAAAAPRSVVVQLEDEIDLSRGDMLVAPGALPGVTQRFRASLVWMHETPLVLGATLLLKHTTRTVRATATRIVPRTDIATGASEAAATLAMNDIAEVEFETSLPLFFDPYITNRALGAFIVIDPQSNATVAAGMIRSGESESSLSDSGKDVSSRPERSAVERPAFSLVQLTDESQAQDLHQRLATRGIPSLLLREDQFTPAEIPAAARALALAGIIAITTIADLPATDTPLITPETLADWEASL